MALTGRIHSVETFGAVDGPGVRYVLFMQGCKLRCLYCHNPDSWKISGGTEMTSDEVANDVEKYLPYIKDGGFTASGGEPLLQADFVAEVIQKVKKLGLHTAIDTAGAVPLDTAAKAIDAADLLLLDLKTADFELHKRLTGRTPEMTLAVLDYCEKTKKAVWIRHVLVPNLTLDEERLRGLAELINRYSAIERVDLLPFHKMGEFKWEKLGIKYSLAETPPPTAEETEWAKGLMKRLCGEDKIG